MTTATSPSAQGSDPACGGGDEAIVFSGVHKSFGRGDERVKVLDGVDLSVRRGQFVTVIGPSGCGKTTLLRLAAGLLRPDAGGVSVFGAPVATATEAKRIGFVPQAPALLPWRSVLDNVLLPLQVNRKAPAPDSPPDAVALLTALGLGDALNRRPRELSGGMQQRVAIARAFVFDPAVLLMDEPFAAVDELTRESLRHALLEIWQASGKTVLFVTHSVTEAVALSDAVVVMSATTHGVQRVIPVDLPRPRDELVETTAEFLALERELRLELRKGSKPVRAPR
ncbi:MAG TPA: ABC transporter ATP-binding protein [Mycobacteriales bacterium]|nr:ABC transporter ATP-binding protein [Mycobacteriales bacterium]